MELYTHICNNILYANHTCGCVAAVYNAYIAGYMLINIASAICICAYIAGYMFICTELLRLYTHIADDMLMCTQPRTRPRAGGSPHTGRGEQPPGAAPCPRGAPQALASHSRRKRWASAGPTALCLLNSSLT